NVVKIADLKNNLSRHLARVRRGGTITVLDRDMPIARLLPMDHGHAQAGEDATHDRITELARKGVITPGDPQGLARWIDDHPPIKRPKRSPTASEVLL